MTDITVQELKQRLDAGEQINLIDVREQSEYDVSNLNGILMPMSNINSQLEDYMAYQFEEVVIHCRSGARSGRVVEALRQIGFVNARNLIGGIKAWADEIDPSMPVG